MALIHARQLKETVASYTSAIGKQLFFNFFGTNEIVDASILVNVVQLFKSQRQEMLSRKDPHLN